LFCLSNCFIGELREDPLIEEFPVSGGIPNITQDSMFKFTNDDVKNLRIYQHNPDSEFDAEDDDDELTEEELNNKYDIKRDYQKTE